MAPHLPVRRTVHRGGRTVTADRELAEETAVAISYNGTTQAVMMATPADLEDFALGLTLTEQIATPDQIEHVAIAAHDEGIEAQITLDGPATEALAARRRAMAGPVGCGLCGIDSLEQAVRAVRYASDNASVGLRVPISSAMAALRAAQPLHDTTRAVHAAGFYHPARGLIHVREDVGRHNALDKLVGALARDGLDPSSGAVLLTSRVSIEMVQKTVIAGARVLVAVSAPTAHAVRLADAAGLTLVAAAREDGYEVYTHPDRLIPGADTDVA